MLLAERANFHSKGSDSSVRFCLPSNLRRALVGIIRITRAMLIERNPISRNRYARRIGIRAEPLVSSTNTRL